MSAWSLACHRQVLYRHFILRRSARCCCRSSRFRVASSSAAGSRGADMYGSSTCLYSMYSAKAGTTSETYQKYSHRGVAI